MRELRKQLKIESESGVKGRRDREAMGRKLAEVQERLIELETRGSHAMENTLGGVSDCPSNPKTTECHF